MNFSVFIKYRQPVLLIIASLLIFVGRSSAQVTGQSGSDQKLEHAITVLRHIEMGKFNEAQQKTKGEEIDAAWDAITKAGATGIARLKEEVRRVDASQEKDDYFKLNATALLWKIGRFDEVETIAAIWRTTPLEAQSNYVFYTAFEAANTQDPRALPLLLACLKNNKFGVEVAKHSMEVRWPLTEIFLWGAYGPSGLPALRKVLANSTDEVELQSTIRLLSTAQDLESLPRIREIAASGKGEIRNRAMESLGIYGHPQDFDLLVKDLDSSDYRTTHSAAYALYEFEDLRAVPYLIRLLSSDNEFVRREALSGLIHLLTPTGVNAIIKFCADAERDTQRGSAQQGECSIAKQKLRDEKIDLDDYATKTEAQKAALLASRLDEEESEFKAGTGDRKLSREQFLELLDGWKKTHRAFDKGMSFEEMPKKDGKDNAFVVSMSKYGWVEMRHILTVASPQDIPLLLAVAASVYSRLSDECLYEAMRLDYVVRRLGRSRYRKVVGITAKAQ